MPDGVESAAPDRVFLVTYGEYSDYRIESIWTTREAAEESARREYGRVEEWLVNTAEQRSVVEWSAWLLTSGEIRISDQPVETAEIGHTYVEWIEPQRRWYTGFEWRGHGYGPSPEHARQALADALAEAKAERLERGSE